MQWKEINIHCLHFGVTLDSKSVFSEKVTQKVPFNKINALLYKIGILSSPAFSLCGEMSESLERVLVSCYNY